MKLKSILILFCFLIQGFIINAQEKVDEGVGNITIDQKREVLGNILAPIEGNDLWEGVFLEGYVSSVAIIKKPKKVKFFGMKASRVEVHFTPYYDEELDEENGEDIYEFNIFIEYTDEEQYPMLVEKVKDEYGPIFTYSIRDDDSEAPNWFSSITLLSIAKIEKDGKKYILVNYQRAYGG